MIPFTNRKQNKTKIIGARKEAKVTFTDSESSVGFNDSILLPQMLLKKAVYPYNQALFQLF